MAADLLGRESGASFSEDRVYRYRLWRRFAPGPTVAFCMLNPSTADEARNDPTVERCQRRAVEWGFGRMDVVNLFALRATDPKMLYLHRDPIGGWEGTSAIFGALHDADLFVAAWGTHGAYLNRGAQILDAIKTSKKTHVLRMNRDGSPAHPLYLPYHLKPTRLHHYGQEATAQ